MGRFDDLPRASDSLTAGERLRLACELSDAAVALVRARLHREHPEETDEAIEGRVRAWQATRPGAEHGDAVGRHVAWPRAKAVARP